MWECEFYQLQKTDHSLQCFTHNIRPPRITKPLWLEMKSYRQFYKTTCLGASNVTSKFQPICMSIFSEMTPIFKNINISIDDIGLFMTNFVEECNIMTTPRRSLIGSMFGKKVLLATPLLKWNLTHGLEVTKIYQVIEYTPKACFKDFGDAVSNARRTGDTDPSKAIIADTMKLIGNSSYGKIITNKDRHQSVKVATTEARKKVNEPLFRDINEISDNCHEVAIAKKTMLEDLPVQSGFFVYQYAKLRILEFYYDFLDRADYQYVEMDTDSAYIALAGDSLTNLVKPDLREVWARKIPLVSQRWYRGTQTIWQMHPWVV